MTLSGVILAAGKGTRMVSELPKALHPVCGIPLTEHCVRAMRSAGVPRPIVVVGHGAERVQDVLGPQNDYAAQSEQLGTGHALMQALPALRNQGATRALTMPGDAPLVTGEMLTSLLRTHEEMGAQLTFAVCQYDDPTGYGRVLRNQAGEPVGIVEERDCTPQQRLIKEVCTSLYCFEVALLADLLPRLKADNAQQEYYLTDIIGLAAAAGYRVATWTTPDPTLLMGVNDRWQLSQAAEVLRMRKLKDLATSGVTITDPKNSYVDMDVQIGPDTVVEPGCCIKGTTRIGRNCTIGPGTRIVDGIVEDGATVLSSNVVESEIGFGTRVGPFAHLRPGTKVGRNCSIGDFVELKNSEIGDDVSIGHLAYVGDAMVGSDTNIGAGTITCNYDGKRKHRTVIGKGVFIGSNNTLVAPVQIGDGAFTAAGSTITEDVEPDALAVARARQVNKEEWARKWRTKQ